MKHIYITLFLLLALLAGSCERPTDSDIDNDNIPPEVPAGLRFYLATDGEIIIEWNRNSEPDIQGYNVYRKVNNSGFENISFTSNYYYYDDSLNYEDEYFYMITAVDIFGQESRPTGSISTKPINRYQPYPPRYIEINARNWEGNKSIYLNWEPSTDTDVAGYNIYRSESETFTADSLTLTGFSETTSFNDISVQDFYKKFYYRVKAVDKGGLLSDETNRVTDEIYEIPEVIIPANSSTTEYFGNFKIMAADVPATYKIVVQTNKYFGEFWSRTINSSVVNDTLEIGFNPRYLESREYFWRVITYSASSEPNSISPVYSFTIKP
ncbi:MAG: hypothetical protein R6W90_15415 [Ignavibacteriaceae bacterium]